MSWLLPRRSTSRLFAMSTTDSTEKKNHCPFNLYRLHAHLRKLPDIGDLSVLGQVSLVSKQWPIIGRAVKNCLVAGEASFAAKQLKFDDNLEIIRSFIGSRKQLKLTNQGKSVKPSSWMARNLNNHQGRHILLTNTLIMFFHWISAFSKLCKNIDGST